MPLGCRRAVIRLSKPSPHTTGRGSDSLTVCPTRTASGRPEAILGGVVIHLLGLSGVSKTFGARTVLDGLDLEVADDARIGVIGANGSGKSTLLRLLHGERPAGRRHDRAPPRHGHGGAAAAGGAGRAHAAPDRAGGASRPGADRAGAGRGRTGAWPTRRWPATSTGWTGCCGARRCCWRSSSRPAATPSRAAGGRCCCSWASDETAIDRPSDVRSGGQRKLIALAACLAARARPAAARRAGDAPGRRGAQPARGSDPRVRRRRRHGLARSLPAGRDGDRDRRAGRRPDPDLAGQLLHVRRRAGARAGAPAAAVRDPAEGDRPARGGDPPVQAVGQHGRQRAAHQAGAQQAAPDRPDGQDRPAGAGAAQDGPATAQRAAAAASAWSSCTASTSTWAGGGS